MRIGSIGRTGLFVALIVQLLAEKSLYAAVILQCGAQVEGIVEIEEVHEYCFDALAGEVVSVTLLDYQYMYFDLFAPSGEESGSFTGRVDLEITETGRHTLRVFDEGLDQRRGYTLELRLPGGCSTAGGQHLPGDCNQDGQLDISDGVCIFRTLFSGDPTYFPCGDGTPGDAANLALLDWNGQDAAVNLSDGIAVLQYLFRGGPPHRSAVPGFEDTACIPIPGCPGVSAGPCTP
jgi:hypothetical protein